MTKKLKSSSRYLLAAGLAALAVYSPEAFAAGSVDPSTFLTKVIDVLTGSVATSLAVIACVIMGFGCLFGMFDFRKVGFFIVGIVFIFGAAWIVSTISGQSI